MIIYIKLTALNLLYPRLCLFVKGFLSIPRNFFICYMFCRSIQLPDIKNREAHLRPAKIRI